MLPRKSILGLDDQGLRLNFLLLLIFQSGVLTHQSKQYVIETLSPNHEEFERVKRDTFLSNSGENRGENEHLVLIYDLDDSRKCGLKPQNKKRLLAPPWSDRVKILKVVVGRVPEFLGYFGAPLLINGLLTQIEQ